MSSIFPAAGTLTVILSAELDWRSAHDNNGKHVELRTRLATHLANGKLLSVLECHGAYKGVPERSIAINGRVGAVLGIAQAEADRFGQECYLVIDKDSSGALHFTESGDQQAIGHYQACSPVISDDWTTVLAVDETFTFR